MSGAAEAPAMSLMASRSRRVAQSGKRRPDRRRPSISSSWAFSLTTTSLADTIVASFITPSCFETLSWESSPPERDLVFFFYTFKNFTGMSQNSMLGNVVTKEKYVSQLWLGRVSTITWCQVNGDIRSVDSVLTCSDQERKKLRSTLPIAPVAPGRRSPGVWSAATAKTC